MSHEARTRLANVRGYVAIDTETTGFDVRACELIEVGAVRMHDGEVAGEFSSLVRPSALPIPKFIEGLTGIESVELAAAPSP